MDVEEIVALITDPDHLEVFSDLELEVKSERVERLTAELDAAGGDGTAIIDEALDRVGGRRVPQWGPATPAQGGSRREAVDHWVVPRSVGRPGE